MPRPRTYHEPRVATAVRLPASLHRQLHATASARQVSANLLVTRAVADLLERLPALDDELEVDEPRADQHPVGEVAADALRAPATAVRA